MGFVLSDLLGVAAVLSLLPGLAQAQTAQPVAPPAPTNPPAAAAFAPPPAAAPPAATPVAPGPPAAAPAPVAPAPAAGPVQLQPIAAAPGPIQLAPPGGGEAKAPEPRRIIDPHAAIKSSPFMDATLAGMWLEQRFGDPIVFGLQGGAYLAQTVRLVLRIEMPSKNATDEFRTQDDDPGLSSPAYFPRNSKAASLLYGASLGVVAASGEGFVFAPGLALQRSDVEDYGTMLGIAMPFEWVTTRGLRFGMEVDLGRAFGGTVHYTCSQSCPDGPTFDGHRGAGRAFALRFQMGFGFNHPR